MRVSLVLPKIKTTNGNRNSECHTMSEIDLVYKVAQLIALLVALLVGFFGVWRRVDRRQTQSEIQTARVIDKLDRIESQFGANGGGMREAINSMSCKIDKIETRTNIIDVKLASLGGKFDEHTHESEKVR